MNQGNAPGACRVLEKLGADGMGEVYRSIESGAAAGGGIVWRSRPLGGLARCRHVPLWSGGRERASVHGDTMMKVDVDTGPSQQPGMPVALFRCPVELRTAPTRNFDTLPDG